MLEYKTASLTDAPERIIAHGCNLKGKMGKGVAKALRDKWPKVFTAYEYAVVSGGLSLGSVNWVEVRDDRWVANVMTQATYGTEPSIRYASYDAIDKGLRKLIAEARERNILGNEDKIAIPKIGASNGNADWEVTSRIIERISKDTGVDFVIYDLARKTEDVQAKLFS